MSGRHELHERISRTFEPRDIARIDPTCVGWIHKSPDKCSCPAPNYDTDEYANARLLEAMPEPNLHRNNDGNWVCWYDRTKWDQFDDEKTIDPEPIEKADQWIYVHADRKIAIVNAYAKWKQLA